MVHPSSLSTSTTDRKQEALPQDRHPSDGGGGGGDPTTGVKILSQQEPDTTTTTTTTRKKQQQFTTSTILYKHDKPSLAPAQDYHPRDHEEKKKHTGMWKPMDSWRTTKDEKVVGLKTTALSRSTREKRQRLMVGSNHSRRSAGAPSHQHQRVKDGVSFKTMSIEEKEEVARAQEIKNPFLLLYLGNVAAMKVMIFYMFTLETIITCGLTAGLTVYWYVANKDNPSWLGARMDFVLLAFALTAPLSAAITMAFNRRERGLIAIADFRTWSYHLYLAHSLWDWPDNGGRAAAPVDWVEHCDAVMAQLVGIGDELARFLSLPTTSRSRHRMTKAGRIEAARTTEVAYDLLESMSTQRITRLVLYSERIKKIGLPSGELSRIRQYERFLSNMIEQLRIIKMYRTPQAFRSFARIFTFVLPPFYAPTFAQVALDVNSLGVGVTFGIITALGLTMLFESLQILEDPFTAFLTLDGIDVKEEFEVLHFAQLLNTRKLIFPDAPEYPAGRRAALTAKSAKPSTALGTPPRQIHHVASMMVHHRHAKTASSLPDLEEEEQQPVADSDDRGAFGELLPVVDQESLSEIDEDKEAKEELGYRMDDEDQASWIRLTAFGDAKNDNLDARIRTGSMSTSDHKVRKRHNRQWSHG